MRFVSDLYKSKYFKPTPDGKRYQANEEVKKLIQFKRLNLSDDAKLLFMKGMDLIYCCNVLIISIAPQNPASSSTTTTISMSEVTCSWEFPNRSTN